jgi:H+/gluconate symporter-like permease
VIHGAAILGVFVVFAALMYRRIVPALLAVPLMAVAMGVVAGIPLGDVGTSIVGGAGALASVYVTVIFGALLGRVTIDTGIARALVNLAAEYGGERPLALALVLCGVVALLFVSLSGLGAIIMVGSIVLPIMMTTGVPRKIAATLFLMAFALGFIFNIVNWKFYTTFFGVTPQQLIGYAIVLAVIDLVALVAYAVISMRNERDYATWAVKAAPVESVGVGWWALIAPVLPILLYFSPLHLDPMLAFAVSAIYAALATRPRQVVTTLVAAGIRGVEDVAPAILLFIAIGMLLAMTKQPQFLAALQPLIGNGWASNPIAFVVIFGLLSPLVLYRGPLNPFGVGIAIFTVLLATHVLPPIVLVAAVMAVVQVQNVCDPTNTANVWVANFTGTPIAEITKRTLPYQVAVATLACIAAVVGARAFFGATPFAALVRPALADAPVVAGMLAAPGAAMHVAIDDDGSAWARAGADAVAAGLNATAGLTALREHDDPNASDCAHKAYAAYVQVRATTFTLVEGTDLDIGIILEDCGGWGVGEWHDHQVFATGPTVDDARTLALAGLARMRLWAAAHPVAADHLYRDGLAFRAGQAPTYYYTLFKTVDGKMRAFVRAGGPAYDAGLRTNDVVDKLDGQFWWVYGTYQTQARAFDGKPHSFQIERAGKTIDLQLGTAFYAS